MFTREQAAEVFGGNRCMALFGDPGSEPAIPNRLQRYLNAPCPVFQDQTVCDTHELIFVPGWGDNTVLTIDRIQHLTNNQITFSSYFPALEQPQFVGLDMSVRSDNRPYWMLRLKSILPESDNKYNIGDYRWVVKKLRRRSGFDYRIPGLFELALALSIKPADRRGKDWDGEVCSQMMKIRQLGTPLRHDDYTIVRQGERGIKVRPLGSDRKAFVGVRPIIKFYV